MKYLYRLSLVLLTVLLALQIYTWSNTLSSVAIGYNKTLTYLAFKERKIRSSSDIAFLKQEALNGIATGAHEYVLCCAKNTLLTTSSFKTRYFY